MLKGEEITTTLTTNTTKGPVDGDDAYKATHIKLSSSSPPRTARGDDDVAESNDQTRSKSKENVCNDNDTAMSTKKDRTVKLEEKENGRERLKRHRIEVAGRVWIPEMWGQEDLLKDWIDCSAFDASLVNHSIMSARTALVQEGRRATSARLRVQDGC